MFSGTVLEFEKNGWKILNRNLYFKLSPYLGRCAIPRAHASTHAQINLGEQNIACAKSFSFTPYHTCKTGCCF